MSVESNWAVEGAAREAARAPRAAARELAVAPLLRPVGARFTFTERRWLPLLMVCADVLVLQLSVGAALLLRLAVTPWFPISLTAQNYAGVAVGILMVPLVFYLLGLYPGYGVSPPQRLMRQINAITMTFLGLCTWDLTIQQAQWSRGILLAWWACAVYLVPLCTGMLIRALIRWDVWGTPVLVVAPADEASAVVDNLVKHPVLGFVPIGLLSNDGQEQVGRACHVPYLGDMRNANRYSEKAKTILIVRPGLTRRNYEDFIMRLDFPKIILVPTSFGGRGLWVSACDLGDTSGVQIRKNLLVPLNHSLKRAFDCILGIPLFLLSVPVLALSAMLIFIVSPANPFFTQVREGRGGKHFRLLKLRTMIPNAERRLNPNLPSNAPNGVERRTSNKPRKDPRTLPVIGPLLRKSSLDELPQLWNVLKGEMSLVGPRPFPHYHLEKFHPGFRELRRTAVPGITGLWQIEVRSDSDLGIQEKLDTYYIQNWSLWLDLYILTRTPTAVVSGKGAR